MIIKNSHNNGYHNNHNHPNNRPHCTYFGKDGRVSNNCFKKQNHDKLFTPNNQTNQRSHNNNSYKHFVVRYGMSTPHYNNSAIWNEPYDDGYSWDNPLDSYLPKETTLIQRDNILSPYDAFKIDDSFYSHEYSPFDDILEQEKDIISTFLNITFPSFDSLSGDVSVLLKIIFINSIKFKILNVVLIL